MKTMRIFFKAMMIMAFAFVTLNSVNAQSVKDGANMSEVQIAQYLKTNPKDTVKVFVSEAFANDTLCVTTRLYYKDGEKFVTRLNKDKSLRSGVVNTVPVVERKKRTYVATQSDSLTLDQKRTVLNGQLRAFDPEHRNEVGWDRHKININLLLGANYIEQVNPELTFRMGYETCHWLWELEGTFSTAKYTEESAAGQKDRYYTFMATGNVGYKVWQDRLCRHYLAVIGNFGYGLQKSDVENAEIRSENYGITGGLGLRYQHSLSRHLKIVGEGWYKVRPKVLHSGNGQEWSANGPSIAIGVSYTFRTK